MKRAMQQYPNDKSEMIHNIAVEGIYWAKTYFGKGPITTNNELLQRHAIYISTPTSQIKIKSANTSILNRSSYKKKVMFDALNNEFSLSKKLEIEKPFENTNVNFMIELVLASRLAEYSPYILRIINLSENTKNLPRLTRTPDFLCVLRRMQLHLDTKAGANAFKDLYAGSIGEVSYTKTMKPYVGLLQTDLDMIQAKRIQRLNHNSDLKDRIITYTNNSKLDVFEKNGRIQETMCEYLNKHPQSIMRPSLYGPIIIKDSNLVMPQDIEEVNEVKNYIARNLDEKDIYINQENISYFLAHVIQVVAKNNPQIRDNVKDSIFILTGTGAEIFAQESIMYN